MSRKRKPVNERLCLMCHQPFVNHVWNAQICAAPECRRRKNNEDARFSRKRLNRKVPTVAECVVCQQLYSPNTSRSQTCSVDCYLVLQQRWTITNRVRINARNRARRASTRPHTITICKVCGTAFEKSNTRGAAKTCSPRCARLNLRQLGRQYYHHHGGAEYARVQGRKRRL